MVVVEATTHKMVLYTCTTPRLSIGWLALRTVHMANVIYVSTYGLIYFLYYNIKFLCLSILRSLKTWSKIYIRTQLYIAKFVYSIWDSTKILFLIIFL